MSSGSGSESSRSDSGHEAILRYMNDYPPHRYASAGHVTFEQRPADPETLRQHRRDPGHGRHGRPGRTGRLHQSNGSATAERFPSSPETSYRGWHQYSRPRGRSGMSPHGRNAHTDTSRASGHWWSTPPSTHHSDTVDASSGGPHSRRPPQANALPKRTRTRHPGAPSDRARAHGQQEPSLQQLPAGKKPETAWDIAARLSEFSPNLPPSPRSSWRRSLDSEVRPEESASQVQTQKQGPTAVGDKGARRIQFETPVTATTMPRRPLEIDREGGSGRWGRVDSGQASSGLKFPGVSEEGVESAEVRATPEYNGRTWEHRNADLAREKASGVVPLSGDPATFPCVVATRSIEQSERQASGGGQRRVPVPAASSEWDALLKGLDEIGEAFDDCKRFSEKQ